MQPPVLVPESAERAGIDELEETFQPTRISHSNPPVHKSFENPGDTNARASLPDLGLFGFVRGRRHHYIGMERNVEGDLGMEE